MDTLRGLNYARKAKNTLFNFTDEAGKYVVFILWSEKKLCLNSLPVLELLALLAILYGHFLIGILSMITPFIIIMLEVAWLAPSVEEKLRFFFENYLWRGILYLILAIPSFFSFQTIIGAILVVIGAVAYAVCSIKGEEPEIGLDEEQTAGTPSDEYGTYSD